MDNLETVPWHLVMMVTVLAKKEMQASPSVQGLEKA
jgi:hypothetical protein